MVFVPNFTEGVQAPAASLPDQTKNGTEVIREDNATEPTNVAQTCSLEDFFFLGKDLFIPLGIVRWDGVWIHVSATFVDLEDLPGNVLVKMEHEKDSKCWLSKAYVVVTVEENQDNTASGWQEHQPIFSEDIREEQSTTIADSDFVLVFLDVTVERGKINVRRSLVDADIGVRGLEDTVNINECCNG